MSIAIIANPMAGRGKGLKTAQLTKQLLQDQNEDFQLILTEGPGHAIDLARRASRNHEVVTALGGDGTIREVLQGLWQTKASLGIIPGGTGNDYARSLNIPKQTSAALQVLQAQNKTLLDVGLEGEQGDRTFGVLASVGFPVDVIEHVNTNHDRIWKGKLAFLIGIAATVRNLRSFPVQITIDGQVIERRVVGLFAMNMAYGGGGMKFTPAARFNDDRLHLLIIGEITRTDLAVTLPKIYSGKHTGHPDLDIISGSEIKVESDLLPIMLDGDVFPARPLRTKIVPRAISVVVP